MNWPFVSVSRGASHGELVSIFKTGKGMSSSPFNKVYLAQFRRGAGAMSMTAVDYYTQFGNIVEHTWTAEGLVGYKQVKVVPKTLEGFRRIDD